MEYTLRDNEQLNGGYTVKIGGFTLRNIGKYSPSWSNEYDSENSFVDYLGNQQKILKGRRFSIEISTGRLTADDFNSLVTELKSDTIAIECPDFTGDCYCESIPGNLEQANFNGIYYKIPFKLIAKDLITDGGGL